MAFQTTARESERERERVEKQVKTNCATGVTNFLADLMWIWLLQWLGNSSNFLAMFRLLCVIRFCVEISLFHTLSFFPFFIYPLWPIQLLSSSFDLIAPESLHNLTKQKGANTFYNMWTYRRESLAMCEVFWLNIIFSVFIY